MHSYPGGWKSPPSPVVLDESLGAERTPVLCVLAMPIVVDSQRFLCLVLLGPLLASKLGPLWSDESGSICP